MSSKTCVGRAKKLRWVNTCNRSCSDKMSGSGGSPPGNSGLRGENSSLNVDAGRSFRAYRDVLEWSPPIWEGHTRQTRPAAHTSCSQSPLGCCSVETYLTRDAMPIVHSAQAEAGEGASICRCVWGVSIYYGALGVFAEIHRTRLGTAGRQIVLKVQSDRSTIYH